MSDELARRKRLTFAQAEGAAELPRQLRSGEISAELRALLWQAFYSSISYSTSNGHVRHPWRSILFVKHVAYDYKMADEFSDNSGKIIPGLKSIFEGGNHIRLFDLVQWFLRAPQIPPSIAKSVAAALETTRSAYRVVDNDTIVPIGSELEAASLSRALESLSGSEFGGARAHLKTAAGHLTGGRWADSVRESVHAVESVARVIEPSPGLGRALAKLEKDKRIHAGLKAGFGSIYGYSSDEQGIRHPLVDDDEASVDEADALFMIGACASFVTYLIGKARGAGLLVENPP